MNTRKYWIDNVRTICILLLFPFHTVMIFNDLGEKWYINGTGCMAASMFNFCVYPWWMSGLFVLAGLSTMYALKRRNIKEYMRERVLRLFVPLMFGLFLIVPIQNFLADKYHNGYAGSYFAHFSRFFKITDFSGNDGCFSPGHLWFSLYLFVISMLCIPVFVWYRDKGKYFKGDKFTGWKLIVLGIIPTLIEPLGSIGGKSVTEFLGWFLIGYFVMSTEEVQIWIKKYYKIWLAISVSLILSRCICYYIHFYNEYFWESTDTILGWFGILALFALGMRFLDKEYKFTHYFMIGSYPIYLFHQSYVVIWGYLFVNYFTTVFWNYILIVLLSFVSTIITYEITRRFSVTRFMFGIKSTGNAK
jgi:glucans biosynthesis protein C